MKKWMVLVLMLVSASVFAQTEKGQSSVGANVGYTFDSEQVSLGIDYRYSITDEVRIAPSITHFVKNNHLSTWNFDVNAHYLVQLSDVFGFYPLAGLSLSLWNAKDITLFGKKDANFNRFGMNVGLGAEVYATQNITVGLEVKYHIIKDFDQALIAVRAAYVF
ncbi:opacity protein-like surface antigen [Parabacteroides sp. PFB2-12]|uniref:porin family protein n=1 Tax=unclassified Parabacteroides TaxID=2649774 RepID=UPI0024767ED9|nr:MULTISPECIES: porin family protein [unclassified Parabacteroides]MDH6343946.1 opacity protein-like surface antigen [Parabacteroides sp. PM6-13]MDH6391693.1 opacity protein-like surface antigen [Parabacteroides sp. PFB2-12]